MIIFVFSDTQSYDYDYNLLGGHFISYRDQIYSNIDSYQSESYHALETTKKFESKFLPTIHRSGSVHKQDSPNEPAQGDAEVDAYRRTMSVRKNRSRSFLNNEFALFSMTLVLVFHHYLGSISQVGFCLHDADREDIPQDEEFVEARKRNTRRRITGKHSPAFALPSVRSDGSPSLLDFFTMALDTIDLFWRILLSPQVFERTLFGVAQALWPPGHGRVDMLDRISSDMLQSIAALKWRVLCRAKTPPFTLLHMSHPRCPQQILHRRYESFMQLPHCCLDEGWSIPVREDLHQHDDDELDDLVERLRFHVSNFSKNSRGVSSREENMHAGQRTHAAGWRASPKLFARQTCQMILQTSLANFAKRSGVTSHHQAPANVRKACKVVQTRKVIHKRPHQFGRAMFTWIASQKRSGSTASLPEMRAQWKTMPQETRDIWERKHRLQVAFRRHIASQAKHHAEQALPEHEVPRSPWGIGDHQHPLKEENLSTFLKTFSQKATGMEALRQARGLEARALYEKYAAGAARYHSMDAATAFARSSFGDPIDDAVANADDGLWSKCAEASKLRKSCLDCHPGVCATTDAAMIPAITALTAALPKKNGILHLELVKPAAKDRVVLFARTVVGLLALGDRKGLAEKIRCLFLCCETFEDPVS